MKKHFEATRIICGIFTASTAKRIPKSTQSVKPVTMNEMEVQRLSQTNRYGTTWHGLPAAKSDIHLEADIHAVKGNKMALVMRRMDALLNHQLYFSKY